MKVSPALAREKKRRMHHRLRIEGQATAITVSSLLSRIYRGPIKCRRTLKQGNRPSNSPWAALDQIPALAMSS